MTIRTGRPPKIHQPHATYNDVTVAEGIVRDLRVGIFKHDAANLAGVAISTLYAWLDRGRDHLATLHAFDSEHPGALDCTHTWTRTKQPRCKHCGTGKSTWDDLTNAHAREHPYVDFLEACGRAQAEAKAAVQGRLLDAMRPLPPQAVLDGNGNPVMIGGQALRDSQGHVILDKDGAPVIMGAKAQVARPTRGDWRAAAWWLERVDPEQYHLPTKTVASAEDVDEGYVRSVRDQLDEELSELADRLAEAEQIRQRALGMRPDHAHTDN